MASHGRKNKANRERRGSDDAHGDPFATKTGLINTLTNSSDQQSLGAANRNNQNNVTPSALISVSRMSSGNYERIEESECESGSSSQIGSEYSGTSSERARKRDLKESNVFLLKVIHGRVPNDLLASRITSTDRENLSTLIPHLVSQQNGQSSLDQEGLTYQDVYEVAQKQGVGRGTEISEAARLNNLSTLIPKKQQTS